MTNLTDIEYFTRWQYQGVNTVMLVVLDSLGPTGQVGPCIDDDIDGKDHGVIYKRCPNNASDEDKKAAKQRVNQSKREKAQEIISALKRRFDYDKELLAGTVRPSFTAQAFSVFVLPHPGNIASRQLEIILNMLVGRGVFLEVLKGMMEIYVWANQQPEDNQ